MRQTVKKVIAVIFVFIMVISHMVDSKIMDIKADTVRTSPLITVEGYQIKTSGSEQEGITFRTVCKAPDIGSTITVDGKNYTVTNLGTIYSKDPNTSGNHQNNILDKSYTEINPIPYVQEGKEFDFKYIGIRDYKGEYLTFGYIATEKGILEQNKGYTSYVRTITNIDSFVTNTIRARAFVEAVDEGGEIVIIYGQYASLMSVAEIAYKVYINGTAPSEAGHKYIYTNILHKLPVTNPYYKDIEEEYGWSGIVGA